MRDGARIEDGSRLAFLLSGLLLGHACDHPVFLFFLPYFVDDDGCGLCFSSHRYQRDWYRIVCLQFLRQTFLELLRLLSQHGHLRVVDVGAVDPELVALIILDEYVNTFPVFLVLVENFL